jgi:hypothetical protein
LFLFFFFSLSLVFDRISTKIKKKTAAQEGHEGVARLLLASGADPNRADGCGRTALKVRNRENPLDERVVLPDHIMTGDSTFSFFVSSWP